MTPDVLFVLALAIKMLVAALFVIAATVTAERSGAVVGALVATLPITAGPSYVFLALDHPPEFLADSAMISLVGNVATASYAFAFVIFVQRLPLVATFAAAIAAWITAVVCVTWMHWTPLTAALLNVGVLGAYHIAARRYRDVEMPRLALRPTDIVMRGLLVALLVAALVTLSFRIGPTGSGLLAIFPLIYTSIMLVMYRRVGAHAAAAVIANGFLGLTGFAISVLTLQVTVVPLGAPAALALALTVAISWNLSLYVLHRQRATV